MNSNKNILNSSCDLPYVGSIFLISDSYGVNYVRLISLVS